MHDLWNQTSHTSQHMACCPKSTLDWQQPHGKTDLYDGLGPGLICMICMTLQREKHLFCKRTCEHSARLGVFWIMSITSQVIAWVGGKAWLWSRQGTTVRAVNLASSQRVRRNVCVFMAVGWLLGCGSKGKTGHMAEGWRFMPSWWHWQHKRTLTGQFQNRYGLTCSSSENEASGWQWRHIGNVLPRMLFMSLSLVTATISQLFAVLAPGHQGSCFDSIYFLVVICSLYWPNKKKNKQYFSITITKLLI